MTITNDGKIYRCIRMPDDLLRLGEWQILYDGQWLKVRNYEIRRKLFDLIKTNLSA